MIGSLVYYVLFPLTRFVYSLSGKRPKCSPEREGPSVFMNGSEVWDGGGTPVQRLSEDQTACLGQWLNVGSQEQMEEGLKGGETQEGPTHAEEPGKEEESGDVQEGVALVCQSRKESVTLREEPSLEVGSSESKVGTEEEVGGAVQTEELGNEGLVPEGLTQTEGEEQEAESKGPDFDPTVESAGADGGGQHCVVPDSVLDLGALLTAANMQTWRNFEQPTHPGWHFPTGPGLSDVVHCPSWQFSGLSYYPQQEMVPFEVMWRVWESLSEPHAELEHLQGAGLGHQESFDFTVMSYNILAQDLLEANPDLYRHCAPEVLAWDFRFQNILREFEKWDPDILCLQEVQENHYVEQLHPALCNLGYACVYKRRTGSKTDGCAICYRRTRFSQLSVRLVEFYRPKVEMLHRDNVGMVLLLQPITLQDSEARVLGPPLCVANTHLLFNPRRGDVKLTQLAMLMAEIDCMVKKWKLKGTCCPIILCGDFNSVPNMPLYQFITTGQLYYHGMPAWMISGQEDLSYKTHHRRLFAPLWPSSLGISDSCQFVSGCASEGKESGILHYDHDFLLQLRYCEAALIRPESLELIPGVTDVIPVPLEQHPYVQRFRDTIYHSLNLWSAYSHFITGTNRPEVTTLHSDFGATVDYIFYSSGAGDCGHHGGGGHLQDGGLKLIGRLALLSEEDLWPMKGLPNEIFSSDHLCLLAKFQLDTGPV